MEGKEGRFRQRFDFHSILPPANKTRTSHERNLGSSLGFIKFQNSDPLCPFEFRDPPGFSLQKPGKTCTRGNAEFLKFNYASLVSFFSFSLSFFLLCPFTYDLQKRGKKNCFDYSTESFRQNIFLDTADAWLPPSLERDSGERNGSTSRSSSSN